MVGLVAVVHDADALAVDGGEVRSGDAGAFEVGVEIVVLVADRQIREKHLLGALVRAREGAQHVDLAVLELGEQLVPIALDVLVLPASVGSKGLLVLIGVTASLAAVAFAVVRVVVPAYAHDREICSNLTTGCRLF